MPLFVIFELYSMILCRCLPLWRRSSGRASCLFSTSFWSHGCLDLVWLCFTWWRLWWRLGFVKVFGWKRLVLWRGWCLSKVYEFNGVGWWRICGVWVRLMRYRNLGEFWFGWMKVVFDWWIMFGIVWVKKFCDLVEIWGRYEGLKVFGYGGFREWFEGWEMCVLKNEGRRWEKN